MSLRLVGRTGLQPVALLAVLWLAGFSAAALAQDGVPRDAPRRQQPPHEDLSKAYGFCLAQQRSLNRIAKTFPAMRMAVRKAEASFAIVFRPACDNVGSILKAAFGTHWDDFLVRLRTQLVEMEKLGGDITSADADAFIATVERRASGDIESPIIETLLAHNPSFQARPHEELQRGFVVRYRTARHPKAKGLDMTLRYPRSWGTREGERPNVVQFFASDNGRGPVNLSLVVRNIGAALSASERETLKTVEGARTMAAQVFSPQGLAELAGSFGLANQRTLSSGRVVIDRWPGAVLDVIGETTRVDFTVTTFSRTYSVLYRDYLVVITCMVAQLPNEPEHAFTGRIAAYDAVFRLIANSVVILSQY